MTTPPTLQEFQRWPAEQVAPLIQDKVIVFSPGGSSRWYFLEHGNPQQGYSRPEDFRTYGEIAFRRAVELVAMMFADGIRTILFIATTPKQRSRDENYNKMLSWGYGMLADDDALALYDHYKMHVRFRGSWAQFGAPQLAEQYERVESLTQPQEREAWLIWLTDDDPVPASLVPYINEMLQQEGRVPTREELCQTYYGRQVAYSDMFITNNKPSVEGQTPPLVTMGDLYFTVAPTYYMEPPQWRSILYDHLFARRGHYRDYTKMDENAFRDMRQFYEANRDMILGVGAHHGPTQTWRPAMPFAYDATRIK